MICNTCVRPASNPFRVYDERGRVIMGCVDECHTGHLATPSESARWHARPEAKKLRTANRRRQAEMDRDARAAARRAS